MSFAGIRLAKYYLHAGSVAAVWIGATGHVDAQDVASIAFERRLEAVSSVNGETIFRRWAGAVLGFNRVFKAARKADPGIRYSDYLQARKLAMLETFNEGSGA
jgi:hypothetical protein